MSQENPPRSDQFWMADPLSILIQTVLTKPFHLEDQEIEVANAQVLRYIEFLSQSKTLEEAWQQRSFYELLVDNSGAEENAPRSSHELFVSIFRSNRQMAPTLIDFETYFPPALEQVNIPPVPVPIVPVSYRFRPGDPVADEVTVVSWIPGLELEMRTPYWAALNEFFAARRVSCLWAEPEAIRRFLATARQPLRTVPRLPRETIKAIELECSDKSSRPWIDLRQFVSNRDLIQEFGLGRMQRFTVVVLSWHKPFLTLAVSKPLSPQDKSFISQGLHSRGTILSEVLADEPLIKEWISRAASDAANIKKFAAAVRIETGQPPGARKPKRIDLQSLQNNVANRQPEDVVEVALASAIDCRASDIMFQSVSANRTLRIKFKKDGDWTEPVELADIGQNVLSFLKTQARLDTSKTDKPQDGQFRREYENREYLFRINTTFNFGMETAILRLQPDSSFIPTLEGLGMAPYLCTAIRTFISGPQGLMIFTGPAGSGKCWGRDTKLICYDGTVKKVQDIQPGDILIGPDSAPRRVLSTTTGHGPLFRISPIKGLPWVCNDKHILTLRRSVQEQDRRSDGRIRSEGEFQAFGDWFRGGRYKTKNTEYRTVIDVPLEEFLARTPKKGRVDTYWKLFRVPIDFQPDPVLETIDPDYFYYMGLWLRNGTKMCNRILTVDKEVIEWTKTFSQKFGYSHSAIPLKNRPHLFRVSVASPLRKSYAGRHPRFPFIFTNPGDKPSICINAFLAEATIGGAPNQWKAKVRRTERPYRVLFQAGTQKAIPSWAKKLNRTQRLHLLAGLIDSDGHFQRSTLEITLKSEQMIEALAFICQSLGFGAHKREKLVKQKSYYRLTLSGPCDQIPTKIARKRAGVRKQKKNVLNTGWSADAIGTGEYFGFELDGDGRCLLEDFTVTHNSTSIYSIIKEQPAKRMNIITGECPIEVLIPWVTQDEITEGGRYTLASFTRSLVRRQPCIAMIQEIRDAETGESLIGIFNIAVRVISTLHTNSAAHIPFRLEYFRVPIPYTASVLKLGVHQRLVRKLCPACPEEVPIPGTEYLTATGIKPEWLEEATTLLRGTGCPKCQGKGYIGRSAIFEALIVDQEIEEAITQRKSPRDIRALMTARGEKTLFEQAVRLAASQMISLEEALRLRTTGD
jgi:type II secretory ATPase GspE/PulE/Tfp pilus assembly ATPase PilB-like protein